MAPMGDMPDVPWNVMSLCPCHIEENSPFAMKPGGPIQEAQIAIFHAISNTSRGPTS
jgi:hypothetical protein